jgi:hypothetical protein
MKKISGYYDNLQGGGYTNVNLYLDSGPISGTAIQAAVQYDWTGDGTFDRTEIFFPCTPNDLVDYELCTKFATTNIDTNLFSVTGDATYQRLQSGTVRLVLWGAFNKFHNTTLRSEFNGVQTSFVKIPYISTYTSTTNYACTVVTNTNANYAPTTGPATTGIPCWDNVCSSYVPQTSAENTNPVTRNTVAPTLTTAITSSSNSNTASGTNANTDTGSGCNPPCQSEVCHQATCISGQCFSVALTNTTCMINDPSQNLCFTGVCYSGTCNSNGQVTDCSTTTSVEESVAVVSSVSFFFVALALFFSRA